MNVKTTTLVREACAYARAEGLQLIRGGAWFEWNDHMIIATDPIGAVIFKARALPDGLDPKHPETMRAPGLISIAKALLGVDHFWLYRFWMGFDRGFQIKIVNEDESETKDDVSEFGIALARELFRE